MREIKFRGKATETVETDIDGVEVGDWVYGGVFFSGEHNSWVIVIKIGMECGGVGSGLVEVLVPVKLETLGQSTGKEDQNGVKIYEGDIVLSLCSIPGWMGNPLLVEYSTDDMGFVGKRPRSDTKFNLIGVERNVIGNITENPELW